MNEPDLMDLLKKIVESRTDYSDNLSLVDKELMDELEKVYVKGEDKEIKA
jgi:hypothetical protein